MKMRFNVSALKDQSYTVASGRTGFLWTLPFPLPPPSKWALTADSFVQVTSDLCAETVALLSLSVTWSAVQHAAVTEHCFHVSLLSFQNHFMSVIHRTYNSPFKVYSLVAQTSPPSILEQFHEPRKKLRVQ